MKKHVFVACMLFSLASASAMGGVEPTPAAAAQGAPASFVLEARPAARLLAGTTQLGGSWYCTKLAWNCDNGDAKACATYAKYCAGD